MRIPDHSRPRWLSLCCGTLLSVAAVSPLSATAQCSGDCNADEAVSIDEIIVLVQMAMGEMTMDHCPPGDRDGDGRLMVDELVGAVTHALEGCTDTVPVPTPVVDVEDLAAGNPTTPASVDVTLITNGASVQSVGIDLVFDPARLDVDNPATDCTFGPAASGCTVQSASEIAAGTVRLAVVCSSPRPDGVLATCSFTVNGTASGIVPIANDCSYSDPDFMDFTEGAGVACTDGSVLVEGPTASHTVVPATPTETPTVAVPSATTTVAEPSATSTQTAIVAATVTATVTSTSVPTITPTTAATATEAATTATPSGTSTAIPSFTPTAPATASQPPATASPTMTGTFAPTITQTTTPATATQTETVLPTSTTTPLATATSTSSLPTATASQAPETASPTTTGTVNPTETPTLAAATATQTEATMPSATATPVATGSSTPAATVTQTAVATTTATAAATATMTVTGTATTAAVTATATAPPSATATSQPTATATTAIATETSTAAVPSMTATAIPSTTASPSATIAASATATATASATSTAGTTVSPTRTATPSGPGPDLDIDITRVANLTIGNIGWVFLDVRNRGTAPTTGPITITSDLPGGLRLRGTEGNGYDCSESSDFLLICTYPGPLAPGASLPRLNVALDVEGPAGITATITATVSTEGDTNPANNTASDSTIIHLC